MKKNKTQMKKMLALILTAALALSMTGCLRKAREVIEAAEVLGTAESAWEEEVNKADAEMAEYARMFGEVTADANQDVSTEKEETAEETVCSWPDDEYVHRNDFNRFENGMRICFLDCGKFTPDENSFDKPEEGYELIYFKFYVENEGNYKERIKWLNFTLYADDYVQDYYCGEYDELDAELTPGRATVGYVVFHAPKDAEKIELVYEWTGINAGSATFLYEEGEALEGRPTPQRCETEGAYKVNEAAKNEYLAVTLLSAEKGESYLASEEGEETIRPIFEMENLYTEELGLGDIYQVFCYADGMYCDKTLVLFDSDLYSSLEPGRKCKDGLKYEIPTDAKVVEIDMVNVREPEKIVTFRVR